MIFNSLTYVVFLGLVVLLHRLLSGRARLALLAVASLVFYAFWRVDFALLMVLSASIDFVAARGIAASADARTRKRWLMASLGANLGLLTLFKYTGFFLGNVQAALELAGLSIVLPRPDILLPLGISFYTFQTIGYTVDVYRRHIDAERDWLAYLVFVTFFPQLVAGPIVRAATLLGQLKGPQRPLPGEMIEGVRWIVAGLVLKTVGADNLAPFVDAGFAQGAASLGGADVLTLAFLFGFQIYFDFAAYSQIAIGSALLVGIRLPRNFDFPYAATSPREFWLRWHISLSSWIRDYLYLPLAGIRPSGSRATGGLVIAGDRAAPTLGQADEASAGRPREVALRRTPSVAVLFATWAIMGLWHGAAWTFVLWGLYHALLIAGYRWSTSWRERLPGALRVHGGRVLTLGLCMLAWIPFRADSVEQALALYGRLLVPGDWLSLGMRENAYLVAALTCGGFIITSVVWRVWPIVRARTPSIAGAGEALVTAGLLLLLFLFLRPLEQFIYFQF